MRVTGDSDSTYLFHGNGPAACVHIPPVRESDIFGEGNTLVTTVQLLRSPSTIRDADQMLTGSAGFHLSVIILLAMYAAASGN